MNISKRAQKSLKNLSQGAEERGLRDIMLHGLGLAGHQKTRPEDVIRLQTKSKKVQKILPESFHDMRESHVDLFLVPAPLTIRKTDTRVDEDLEDLLDDIPTLQLPPGSHERSTESYEGPYIPESPEVTLQRYQRFFNEMTLLDRVHSIVSDDLEDSLYQRLLEETQHEAAGQFPHDYRGELRVRAFWDNVRAELRVDD